VIEGRDQGEDMVLSNSIEETMRFVISPRESSPAFQAKLADALKVKET